jgi:hypothetical protein
MLTRSCFILNSWLIAGLDFHYLIIYLDKNIKWSKIIRSHIESVLWKHRHPASGLGENKRL